MLVASAREIADQFFRLVGVIDLAGLAQRPAGGRMMLFRQVFHDVARVVDLAAPEPLRRSRSPLPPAPAVLVAFAISPDRGD